MGWRGGRLVMCVIDTPASAPSHTHAPNPDARADFLALVLVGASNDTRVGASASAFSANWGWSEHCYGVVMRRLVMTLLSCGLAGCASAPTPLACEGTEMVDQVDIGSAFHGVDILIAVDGSPAMIGIDEALRAQVAAAVGRLASGDLDGDGRADFGAELPVRVGVIDMDMGLDAIVPGCGSGGGAEFHTVAATPTAGCPAVAVSADADGVLRFDRTSAYTSDAFTRDVDCAMQVGTSGCPITRGVDAIRAALDPARGFVRPGSWLAILVVSASDDCSSDTPASLASAVTSGTPIGLVCHLLSDRLSSLDDAAHGIADLLSAGVGGALTIDVVTGIPEGRDGSDPMGIASDPSMAGEVDPASGTELLPVCTSATGRAVPGRRWAQFAAAFGTAIGDREVGSAMLSSVCGEHARVLEQVEHASRGLTGMCLRQSLNPDAAGRVACRVEVTLPPIGTGRGEPEHCADLWHPEVYTLLRTEAVTLADGRLGLAEVCHLRQLAQAEWRTESGWIYDDGTVGMVPASPCFPVLSLQRVTVPNGMIRLLCDDAAPRCDPALNPVCASGQHCDAFTRTCQDACETDADCMGGTVCDRRPAADYFTTVPPGIGPDLVRGSCAVPTCDAADRR